MERLETIRVVNPTNPRTYMVINKRDQRPSHELWPEQDVGFVPPSILDTVLSPEATVSVRLFGKLMAHKLDMTDEQWARLSSTERTELMLKEEPKLVASLLVTEVALVKESADPVQIQSEAEQAKAANWKSKK